MDMLLYVLLQAYDYDPDVCAMLQGIVTHTLLIFVFLSITHILCQEHLAPVFRIQLLVF